MTMHVYIHYIQYNSICKLIKQKKNTMMMKLNTIIREEIINLFFINHHAD